MADNVLSWLQENREKARLVGYFVVILIAALPVSRMVAQGWEQGELVPELLQIRGFLGMSLEQLSLFMFGVFLGLLVLMTIDHKKRVQATLLWIGTVIASLILGANGLFIATQDPVGNFPWLAGGLVVGLVVGGARKLLDFDSVQTLEFRRASEGVYLVIALVAVISMLEVHLTYPPVIDLNPGGSPPVTLQLLSAEPTYGINTQGLGVNLVSTLVFVGVVNRFIKYDSDHDFFILGPRASGKSLFLIGAYLEALDRARSSDRTTPLNPSEDLMSMIEELDREDTGWIVEATGRGVINELEFQYVHGSVFPTNIQLSSIDYAGEYLERLPDALTGALEDDEVDTTLNRLVENIETANTLILVIDVERFVNNEPLDISQYFSILQAADDKNALLVASKADNLAEEFEEEEGLEAHLYYEEFVDYVNQRLRQNENIHGLVTQVGDGDIHLIYYQTMRDEQGNKVPRRDANGSVVTVGFDELLDKLGRY
jgi:hypothetical protein